MSQPATARDPKEVRIYVIDRGHSVCVWLCPKHLRLRESQGWQVMDDKDPPHRLDCDLRGMGACS